ncbi:MAG: hypothetical protein KH415_08240 [Clostridium sp.]|nr:hypothetical protein [Clostridium sp.]
MDNKQAIKELKELIEDRKSYLVGDYDKSFERHIQALEYAIEELERTAQEVPVQEQLFSYDGLPIIKSEKLFIYGQVVD